MLRSTVRDVEEEEEDEEEHRRRRESREETERAAEKEGIFVSKFEKFKKWTCGKNNNANEECGPCEQKQKNIILYFDGYCKGYKTPTKVEGIVSKPNGKGEEGNDGRVAGLTGGDGEKTRIYWPFLAAN